MRIHMHTRTYILHIHMHIHIHIRLDIDMDMDIDIAIYTHAHHKYIIYTWGRARGGSWDEDGEEECSWNLLCWSAMKPISPSEGNSWGYIHIDYSKKMSNRWNRYIYIVQHIQYIYIYIVLVYILYTNSITLEIQLRPPTHRYGGFPPHLDSAPRHPRSNPGRHSGRRLCPSHTTGIRQRTRSGHSVRHVLPGIQRPQQWNIVKCEWFRKHQV